PGGRRWKQSLDLQQAAPGHGLNRLWARQKIDHLLDSARLEGSEPNKARVTELAVEHTLMSPYTSFVAVDESPARPSGATAETEHLPTLLPAGSQAGMLRYPQTATLAPLFTALGVIGLMFALAIGLLQRRATV
ncbi:MAG: marine proteobacterial sortase target protein, partial [Marinobacter alexandrii]